MNVQRYIRPVRNMTRNLHDVTKELEHLAKRFEALVPSKAENHQEVIDDYIYTEGQESGWLDSERESGQNFTKRIYTPFPTKRRVRVTFRNNIYKNVLLVVTN